MQICGIGFSHSTWIMGLGIFCDSRAQALLFGPRIVAALLCVLVSLQERLREGHF